MKTSKMVDEYRILKDALNTLRYAQLFFSTATASHIADYSIVPPLSSDISHELPTPPKVGNYSSRQPNATTTITITKN
jgi:hypothetical protein